MVEISDKDLFQLLIAEFRYAVNRDNHLAPDTCSSHVKEYLPKMEKLWQAHTAKQLAEEIIDARLWARKWIDPEFKCEKNVRFSGSLSGGIKQQLEEDYVWEDLLAFLTDYLEDLPNNANRYMEHIRGRMTYSEGIDYQQLRVSQQPNG